MRSIYADWDRGDFSRAEWADPEVEMVYVDGPAPGRWLGLAGMAEATRDVLDAWEAVRVEADEYRELDGERVLVLTHRSGRGKGSGLELGVIRTPGANLFHVRDGKVTRIVAYWDRDRALADLGLDGQAVPEGYTTPNLVELTRLYFAAFNRGDFVAYASPDIVLDTAGYGMGTFIGREAANGFLKEWVGSFEELTMEPDEILDLGNGVVLMVYHQAGRPLGASNYVRVRSASVVVWEGGAVVRNTVYPEPDIDEARAAAERLAEERSQADAEESTTPDLVERVREFFAIGTAQDLDGLMAFFASDAVWEPVEGFETLEGEAAIRTFIQDYWSTWAEGTHHHYVEEELDLGHGVVFAAVREDGCPRGVASRVEQRLGYVFLWGRSKIAQMTNYLDIDEARAAAERLAEERG